MHHPDAAKRLRSREADIALRLLGVLVMREVLPAFDFIERRGLEWFGRWPERFGRSWSEDWNHLTTRVVGSAAGWESMLSSLRTFDEAAIALVRSWLHAYNNIDATALDCSDPERLVDRGGTNALVDTYRRKRAAALWNGYQMLALRNDRGWAIYGELRTGLENILRELNGTANTWFFAIASREPEQRGVLGACLLLQRHISDASLQDVRNTGLERLRSQLRRNLSGWASVARGSERAVFERLKQQLSAQSRATAVGAPSGATSR